MKNTNWKALVKHKPLPWIVSENSFLSCKGYSDYILDRKTIIMSSFYQALLTNHEDPLISAGEISSRMLKSLKIQ